MLLMAEGHLVSSGDPHNSLLVEELAFYRGDRPTVCTCQLESCPLEWMGVDKSQPLERWAPSVPVVEENGLGRGIKTARGTHMRYPPSAVPPHPHLLVYSPHLCTQLEVHHDDTDLWTGHYQDDENEKQEPEEVIELILPDRLWAPEMVSVTCCSAATPLRTTQPGLLREGLWHRWLMFEWTPD